MKLQTFDSQFPDGKDPQGRKGRTEHYLGQLQYADVNVKTGDETKKSADLFKNGDYADVLAYLWSMNSSTADDRNDLGCAYAWAWSWEDAKTSLEESEKADGADDSQKKRARDNLGLVAKAKEAASS